MPAPTTNELQSHVVLFLAASALGVERETPVAALDELLKSAPPPNLGRDGAQATAKRVETPMSATALLGTTSLAGGAASPIIATCATLDAEQLVTHELLDRVVKRLLPVLAREAVGADAASANAVAPPTLSAQSPLHADLQDRVKRQREVNRRLRGLLERVVV